MIIQFRGNVHLYLTHHCHTHHTIKVHHSQIWSSLYRGDETDKMSGRTDFVHLFQSAGETFQIVLPPANLGVSRYYPDVLGTPQTKTVCL